MIVGVIVDVTVGVTLVEGVVVGVMVDVTVGVTLVDGVTVGVIVLCFPIWRVHIKVCCRTVKLINHITKVPQSEMGYSIEMFNPIRFTGFSP